MGLFSSFGSKPKSQEDLVNQVIEIAAFGAGDESAHEQANMDRVLTEVETGINDDTNSMLLYWLGVAWRNYTAWHIRGDERKPYLEKAIDYFRRALDKAKSEWPPRQPLEERHNGALLDQITIAGELGSLLVDEKLVRNLDEAEKVLKFVAENTDGYEPCLCQYAELFYKRGDYKNAAKVALDAHKRAVASAKEEWKLAESTLNKYETDSNYSWQNLVAPAPLSIAGKAFRALGKEAKKANDTKVAKLWFGKIIELGVATDNDKKIHNKL